jgi:Domain of unknown function (DUF4158)
VLSSGPCPPSLRQSPTPTSALTAAKVALLADRSPYKSSPTCIALALPAFGNFNCPRLNFNCPRSARDETRREHVQILCKEYRFGQYGPAHSPLLRAYLETEALSADSALTLVESAMEWLRERRVILPIPSELRAEAMKQVVRTDWGMLEVRRLRTGRPASALWK